MQGWRETSAAIAGQVGVVWSDVGPDGSFRVSLHVGVRHHAVEQLLSHLWPGLHTESAPTTAINVGYTTPEQQPAFYEVRRDETEIAATELTAAFDGAGIAHIECLKTSEVALVDEVASAPRHAVFLPALMISLGRIAEAKMIVRRELAALARLDSDWVASYRQFAEQVEAFGQAKC